VWVSTAPKPREKAGDAETPTPAQTDRALEDGWYQVLRRLRSARADDEQD